MSASVQFKRLLGVWVLSQLFTTAALAAPTCVYVVGEVGDKTVTTPAIAVYVPSTTVTTQPIRVHVDPLTYTILGYSVRTPEVDEGVEGRRIFVPSIGAEVSSVSATLSGLNLTEGTCVDRGVETPALPVYIPALYATTPGVVVSTPVLEFNILGQPVTVGGELLRVDNQHIIIPAQEMIIPGVRAETPAETIVIHVNDDIQVAQYLPPPAG